MFNLLCYPDSHTCCAMATSFMQLFWDLSSTVEEERVQSALLLLNELKVSNFVNNINNAAILW